MTAAEQSVKAPNRTANREQNRWVRLLLAGLIGGALGGAVVGLIDGLISIGQVGQFLPSFSGKLRFLGYLLASYGFAGALLGPAAGGTLHLFWRVTRLGDLVRYAVREHFRVRDAEPRDAMVGLSMVLAGLPTTVVMVWLTYARVAHLMEARKHVGLVVAVAMAAIVAAIGASLLITFVLGRGVEQLLRLAARRDRVARLLSHPIAPALAAGLLGGLAVIAGAVAAWRTLSLLHLRPIVAGAALVAGCTGALLAGYRAVDHLRPRHRWAPAGAATGSVLLLVVTTLWLGGSQGVRKAAFAFTGLGESLTKGYRAPLDFDLDGYSGLLGGPDCDDLDSAIHPGASEIPYDGIDQNCIGGDLAPAARGVEAVGFTDPPAAVPDDLNVVLITIDTVRADHFSAYGYHRKTTPNLDALAAEGTLFENAWAHAPSTRYSVPAILTGRYPLDVYYDYSVWWPALDSRATTIAEVLRDRGLYTGAILNYEYFDRVRRMDQGFAHYDNKNRRLHQKAGRDGPAKTRGSSSEQQTDKALEFLSHHAHERFFLWVHYYDPHYEYERHKGFTSFGDDEQALYDHEILFTDHHIGRLLTDLRQRGLYDRTAIVVTGDHGEGFGEHGIKLHGYHLYSAQTKVPMIARIPGTQPRRVTMPVAHIDILPTLANLTGAAPDIEMQGQSLLDVVAGDGDPDRDRVVFQQLSYENNHEMRAAASKQCHVIYNVSPDNTWESYRIDLDPNEERDLTEEPGLCAGTRGELESWYDLSKISPQAHDALLPSRPSITTATEVDFGPHVHLLGVEFSSTEVRPGDSLELTFTFEARGTLTGGWKLFGHFEAPGGGRFLGDHEPARPFAWWRKGDFIQYHHTVHIPRGQRPGDYVLWLGLFKGNDRQPVTASPGVQAHDNRAAVGVVRVTR